MCVIIITKNAYSKLPRLVLKMHGVRLLQPSASCELGAAASSAAFNTDAARSVLRGSVLCTGAACLYGGISIGAARVASDKRVEICV
jgi:hypothetical protein